MCARIYICPQIDTQHNCTRTQKYLYIMHTVWPVKLCISYVHNLHSFTSPVALARIKPHSSRFDVFYWATASFKRTCYTTTHFHRKHFHETLSFLILTIKHHDKWLKTETSRSFFERPDNCFHFTFNVSFCIVTFRFIRVFARMCVFQNMNASIVYI